MNKNILWIASAMIILVPAYFITGFGSTAAREGSVVVPYDVEVITDDSALDPSNVDINNEFNSLAFENE